MHVKPGFNSALCLAVRLLHQLEMSGLVTARAERWYSCPLLLKAAVGWSSVSEGLSTPPASQCSHRVSHDEPKASREA